MCTGRVALQDAAMIPYTEPILTISSPRKLSSVKAVLICASVDKEGGDI